MHIVPVIDLMHGIVVQAIRGQRQHYQPLRSSLTNSHQLIDVVDAILQVYPFQRLYIADLNAIMRDETRPHHQDMIEQASLAFPQIEWWVDAGISCLSALQIWQGDHLVPVLASESQVQLADYLALRASDNRALLSLDYFTDGFRGPAGLAHTPTLWTPSTILMSLPNVGADLGPDYALLEAYQAQSAQHDFYVAGGVRDADDLHQLKTLGAKGVLIASTLHQGRLPKQTLHELMVTE